MNKWLPFELHTHTPHSDGKHSILEMAEKAKELEIFGIALTDHNTMSGLADKKNVMGKTGVYILPGLEWTTFYGHMVTLGIKDYVDWRNLSPLDIHKGIGKIHKQNGLAGIVHPYRIGNPICTGCFWEYEIKDWNDIDYIEVWSETFPSIKKSNKRAYDLWVGRLNAGYKIAATSGRDWHSSTKRDGPIALTYLNINDENITDESIIQSIRDGRLSVTMGPLVKMEVFGEKGNVYSIGDKIDKTSLKNEPTVRIEVDFTVRSKQWKLENPTLKLMVRSNLGILKEVILPKNNVEQFNINIDNLIWINAEIHGGFESAYTMIGFTNPIYFK